MSELYLTLARDNPQGEEKMGLRVHRTKLKSFEGKNGGV